MRVCVVYVFESFSDIFLFDDKNETDLHRN